MRCLSEKCYWRHRANCSRRRPAGCPSSKFTSTGTSPEVRVEGPAGWGGFMCLLAITSVATITWEGRRQPGGLSAEARRPESFNSARSQAESQTGSPSTFPPDQEAATCSAPDATAGIAGSAPIACTDAARNKLSVVGATEHTAPLVACGGSSGPLAYCSIEMLALGVGAWLCCRLVDHVCRFSAASLSGTPVVGRFSTRGQQGPGQGDGSR